MAKKSKIELEFEKSKIDYREIERLLKKVQNHKTYLDKYKNLKFRKLIVENHVDRLFCSQFNVDYDSKLSFLENNKTILTELKKDKYKECVEKHITNKMPQYLYDYGIGEVYYELIKTHNIKITAKTYYKLKQFVKDIDESYVIGGLKTYLLKNIKSINDSNFDLVKDSLTKSQILEIINSFNIRNNDELYEKITFEDYFNYKKSIHHVNPHLKNDGYNLDSCIISKFGIEKCLEFLLKINDKIFINNYYVGEKIDITEEQTKKLLKISTYNDLKNIFNLYPLEEFFGIILGNCDDPSIYSDKINEIILNKEFDRLKNQHNYLFNQFSKINLTKETAKILYKKHILKFKLYKKYLSTDEITKILDSKKETVLYLYNKLKTKNENDDLNDNIEPHNMSNGFPLTIYPTRNYYGYRNLIMRIVEDYDISMDFILSNFEIPDNNRAKLSLVSIALY